ncbi:hypothetical protein [Paractinoplanes durhamensis]|uniref:Adhesin domain-containing protein n=1 Tax=Paractinoplanes durhamensis TaxID=113563 RepID=A0ABQ3Z8U6_9ACTN|nr:hypothetical protein [Actinoplanes durhamensis]GIE06253.1 hypothetical protein Adu01nite_76030 [Actinoplanes durhamensis]
MAPRPPGDEPAHTPEPDSSADVFDYADYAHDDYGAAPEFHGERPGAEEYATGEYPVERYPVAGPLAQNYPAETNLDDRTGEWPAPSEEDTDPVGFEPVEQREYPPPTDPFDDTEYDDYTVRAAYLTVLDDDDDIDLPGWGTPGVEETARGGRVRRYRRPLLVAGLVLFLAGMATAILVAPRWVGGGGDDRTEAVGTAGVSGDATRGPVDGRTKAVFELVDGAATVRVVADDLGDDLYRISTPAGGGVTPKVDDDGDTVRLHLPAGVHGGPSEVAIVLNKSVRWTLWMDGGTAQTTVDLTGAEVDGVELHGGASRIDLTLPEPAGLLPVRMTGGVDQFLVKLAGATPVRVQVQSGAGEVTLAGATHRGIAPGQSFTANGWGTGETGVDVSAVAGMSALTVTEG